MSEPLGLRGELTASIDRTLVREARRNELVIAQVRLVGMACMIGFETWLLVSDNKLAPWMPMLVPLTLVMTAWAGALVALLRAGRWWAWLPIAVTVIDACYVGLREGAVMVFLGVDHFNSTQDLTTVMGMASLLICTAAFRLSWHAVVVSGALGVALYLLFAIPSGIHVFFVLLHLVLLGVIAMSSIGLTHIVDRAVQSEVTRLTVSRLLPATVFDAADADPLALLSEPRSLDVTIVITDLRGFTKWAEHRDPLEVLGFLNTVQGALADVIHRHGGTVDKFMGDGMLAVFGAPRPLDGHADRAVQAARELLTVTARSGEVALGVGIHSGDVVVGCLGSGVRMEFTVLGDTVNTASRLESATKDVGVPVLISAATRERLRSEQVVSAGRVKIRGRDQEVDVYTL
jgi:class 3 adenylate cyclase